MALLFTNPENRFSYIETHLIDVDLLSENRSMHCIWVIMIYISWSTDFAKPVDNEI